MPEHWSCPRGHQGDFPVGGEAVRNCPVCGALLMAPTTVLPPDANRATLAQSAPTNLVNLAPTLSPEAAAEEDAGTRLVPGYEILAEVGRGGMGVVYKARQMRLNRVVALKMILSGAHAGPVELARFRVEAESVAQLQHSNIVQIHDVGDADGRAYLSLEFVEGRSLAEVLQTTPPTARQAARLVAILARAM